MTQPPESLTAQLLDHAHKAGADAADALAMEGRSISIDVLGGKLEHAERSEGLEIGLRVLVDQRQAIVSASDIRPETMSEMAERAVAMAREAPEDPAAGLADPEQLAQDWDTGTLELTDPSDEPAPDALGQDALRAEAAALAVSGVSQVQSAGAGHGQHRIHLAATNGFSGGYERTGSWLHCVAIVGEGTRMERDHYQDSRVFRSDLEGAEDIGRIAGERAVARAGARKPETGSFPVLFDERVASSLIGHLLAAINGTAIVRGSSWLRDALEQQVLPAGLSLTEDPHRPRVSRSRPFDGEGLPTRRREIVADGVLTGWVMDLATARKLGLESTANAARGMSAPPSPAVTNVELTQGNPSRNELIRDMGTGLLVTSMIGSTINPTTGDYSRGASGFWVERGEVVHPVNECTIAGNLREMLLGIVPANDARLHRARIVPSLLVEGMTVAGE